MFSRYLFQLPRTMLRSTPPANCSLPAGGRHLARVAHEAPGVGEEVPLLEGEQRVAEVEVAMDAVVLDEGSDVGAVHWLTSSLVHPLGAVRAPASTGPCRAGSRPPSAC